MKLFKSRLLSSIAVIALMVMMAFAFTTPATAHSSYDGSPFGEGDFTYGWRHGSGSFFQISAKDTRSDGHCVYANAYRAGRFVGQAYSCGSRDYERIYGPGSYSVYVCVTGHWDCDYWASKVVIG